MTLVRFTVFGVIVQSLAIGCWFAVVQTEWADLGKLVVIGLFSLFVAALLFIAEKFLSFRELLWMSLFMAVCNVAVDKILRFTYFPGWTLDLNLLSYDIIGRTFVGFIFVLGCYVLGVCVTLFTKEFIRSLRKSGVFKA